MNLIEQLKVDEGFRAKPYKDTLGVLTIGYGTNIDEGIEQEEAEWLLERRVERTRLALSRSWPTFNGGTLTAEAQEALVGMAYQLGVHGVLKFKRMLAALEQLPPDYETAIAEARASRWNAETPHRVDRLAEAFKAAMWP